MAAAAAEAAASVALARRGDAGRVVAKEAPTDVASEVDRAAEAAAVAVFSAARPEDGYLGEEGAERAGARTWVVDALDGTLNYLHGLNGWCAAVALEDEHGPLAAAVCDPVRRELFTAARGEGAACNGRPLRLGGADGADGAASLDHAVIATFLHQPKRGLRGVAKTLERVFAEAGSVRITGSGTLELAYVAAGRLDGWIQPATYRWDWVPGALLVTEAGGPATRTPADPDWCIAAATHPLHDALERLTR
ncbi:MAG TPA: inositol monophosphatase [Solirubrobacteraceae bacterium]|nr:inositol monophosphatase [Solirubrobacteraceae bacterium]